MLDSSAVLMEYYNTTLKLLRNIYRTVGLSPSSEFPACNQFLLLVLIGWLFEVLSFTPDFSPPTIKDEDDNNDDITEPRLDHIPFVDQSLLYSCCPYLSDIKTLLSESTASSPMRKITPVAASTTQPEITAGFLLSKVQNDLERNFLHTQSPSLKKTVEFVGSRVASNCIKNIDSQELTVKRNLLSELIMKKFHIASIDSDADFDDFIEEKCKVVIRNIVSEEISGQVMRTACSLAIRNSLQKTQRWIHVQIPGAFRQEIESCLSKCSKLQAHKESPTKDESSTDTIHSDPSSTLSTPSVLLQELKDAIYQLLTTSEPDQLVKQHLSLIKRSKEVLKEKHLLPQLSMSALESLLKDLISLTCIVSPSSVHLFVTPPREEVNLVPSKKLKSKTQELNISPSSKSPASNCAMKSNTSESPGNAQHRSDMNETSQNERLQERLREFSQEHSLVSNGNLTTLSVSQTRTDFLQEIISVSKSHFHDKLDFESFFSPRTDLLQTTDSDGNKARKKLHKIVNYFVESSIIQGDDLCEH
ncbi:Codanin-1 [Holothuria leucospilota]|uniref:Codanin-1 n=1 Tax=Holothuria leucospilota TaxID=206669 RepID=A0A9Q1CJM4_HOLLE|nr:Codanin-1 [Holothuria leucospilota]